MRRNIVAWVLLFLAAAAWIYGRADIESATPELSQTEVSGTAHATTIPTTMPFSVQPDTQQPDQEPAEENRRGSQLIGYILCVFAVASAGTAVIALRQKEAIFGPDMVSAVSAVYCWVWHTYVQGQGSAPGVFYSRFAQVLLLFGLLMCLRDFWGWIREGFSWEWCLVFRLAKKVPRASMALSVFAAWVAAAVVGIALIVHGGAWNAVMLLTIFGGFGFAGLWKYGQDIQHFKSQLDRFQRGAEIAVGEGAFSHAEEQLREIQAQHEEAVRKAVTSERFKVELIANVSHDLRTPLTSILGYSELLQSEALSPEGETQLARLHQKAGYMNDLVESLFELTKVSSGVLEPQKQEIDLIRLLEQTIGLFDDRLAASGLVIRRSYPADTILLTTDGARMHQVFANLLGNAIKYALPGTRIYLQVKESADAWVIRTVNTASYEMDFREEEIMQRFARGDKARSTQGSGLGLAIAKTYTESVGGRFQIRVDADQFSAIVELPKL